MKDKYTLIFIPPGSASTMIPPVYGVIFALGNLKLNKVHNILGQVKSLRKQRLI
ncbi:MAG TPA: hypothetical protein VFC84_03190 [Desulfosporosinus sp.]|nr:hypothetical protein [Desulfosporosinus sp.]